MKITRLLLFLLALGLSTWMASCVSKQPDPATGSMQLRFDNVVGNQDLQLTTGVYTNAADEQFSVTKLAYFVSNVRLQRADGTTYVIPQDSSYFLVNETSLPSQTITLNHVPAGEYTSVSYLIGVDSLRSTMDISRRKGALEPGGGHNSGMYWDWNSGYIFFKLEGLSPQVAPDPAGEQYFQFHVGLFGGYDTKTINNLRTVTVPFGASGIPVSTGQTGMVTILADVLRVFDGATRVRLADTPSVMVSPYSALLATNYATMFRFSSQPKK